MPEVAVSKKGAGESAAKRFWSSGPWSLWRELNEEMEQMLRGINGGAGSAGWAPTVDIDRTNGSLKITAELPGVKKEDVKVELSDEAIVIQGERKQERKEDKEGYHRWERSYGQFYRAIPIPEGAKVDEIQAELKDGVLQVTVPVPESARKSRQIPVNG